MGGVEGVRFIPLPISGGGATDAVARMLLSGAILRGRIATDGALLNLVVAGQKMPLPKSVALPAGTPVEVQLLHGSGAPQLRLRVLDSRAQSAPISQQPTPTSQAPVASARIPNLPQALAELIKPDQAAVLLPKLAAIPPKAMEVLLSVFVARSDAGRVLSRLAVAANAEVAEGRAPANAPALMAFSEVMNAQSPEEFQRAIEFARELIEARGHRGAAGASNQLQNSARAAVDDLMQLRDALSARSAGGELRAAGETIKAIDGLVERFANATLQNIRALDVPYQFFAIPFAPQTGIEHAQVHVVGREGQGAGGKGREAHFVALDLQLTNLGMLWITIQSSGPSCSCVIRAENEQVRGAIDAGAPVLEAGLRRAGFSAAQVRTEAWDGDRVAAAAALLSQPSSFEAEV